jgi:hypothetical protein
MQFCPLRNGLAVEDFDKFRNDLIRRFFHEPVPRPFDDHALYISGDEPALLAISAAAATATQVLITDCIRCSFLLKAEIQ